MVIATDKTNSFKLITFKKYRKWVLEQLQRSVKEIDRERIVEIYKIDQETKLEIGESLPEKEENFLTKTFESKSIPTPKLIIKGHKNPAKMNIFHLD